MCRPGQALFRRSPSELADLGRYSHNTRSGVVHWPSSGSDAIFRAQQPDVPPLLGSLASFLALCGFQLPYNLALGNQASRETALNHELGQPALVLSTSVLPVALRSLLSPRQVLGLQQSWTGDHRGLPWLPSMPWVSARSRPHRRLADHCPLGSLSTQPLGCIPWPHQPENSQ